MKKIFLMPLLALCVLCFSCSDDSPIEKPASSIHIGIESPDTTHNIVVKFLMDGDFDFQTQAMTRGELSADGKQLTDIWILDYVGDNLQQQLHQVSTDADFGTPTLNLSVGSHSIYFVASRGKSPTLDTDAHTITFSSVLDTFYKSLSLQVSATSSGSQTVTLERCVTKLKIVFEDEIPTGAATFNVTPSQWYYTIDYTTGLPTTATASQTITVNIPSLSIGKSGESVNIYGFSGSDEWQTDISLNCKASDNTVLGTATITDAPMKRNRITSYTGPLFSAAGLTTLTLSTDWLTEYTAIW